MTLTIGFIGFGEAGQAIATGLAAQGLVTRGYDILVHEPKARAAMYRRAADACTTMFDDLAAMLPPCDLVVSAVFTSNCLAAAQAAAPHLHAGQIYADMNSVAPDVKRAARDEIERHGASYVDAAVMAAVPPRKHRVPMLLAGAEASALLALMEPYEMEMDVLSREVGDAAAAKLFQSILIKGTEALLLECLLAASRNGVERHVLESMSRSTPGLDWVARANYMLSRTARHGARRADEMDEAAATLEAMGIEPMATRGVAQRLHWAAERTHARRNAGEMPGYAEVIAVLHEAGKQ
jgi:3-hydroxyisobutyrate dehydrogenase-like beta-hydroxyacid dehydrogenase